MSSRHANERAEARRRGRIAAREREAAGDQPVASEPVTDLVTTPNASQPRAETGIGFRAAFRGSFGRIPFKDDLRALPAILRTRAFFVPLIATVATVVISIQPGTLAFTPIQIVIQSLLVPALFSPIAFISGMLAKRAAWLIGGISSLMALFGLLTIAQLSEIPASLADNPVTSSITLISDRFTASMDSLMMLYWVAVVGITSGALGGWYGRFLRAMSPRPSGRDQRREGSSRGKGGGRR
jgi:hypothetical protein